MMQQKEIARKLGVSPAMVSMALRGQGRVSPERRAEILALAKHHRVGVRKLRKRIDAPAQGSIRRIAYCGLQERLGWFHIGTFSGLSEPLLGVAYEVSLLLSDITAGMPHAKAIAQLVRSIPAAGYDGLIIGPHSDVVEALVPLGLPLVQIEYQIRSQELDMVAPDNFTGAYRLADGLLKRGCRRIAVVRCLAEDMNSMEKFAGINAAMAAHGCAIDPALVTSGNCRHQAGARCAAALCAASGAPPDAILLENDWHAPEFVQYLRQHLPAHWPRLSQIRFAMYCDSERENTLTTPYDRIMLPRGDMGHLAVRRVLEHLASPGEWRPLSLRVAPLYQPSGE
jgi:LacI family transcriptional regulator